MKTATISPLTRIEGHLAIHTEVEAIGDGKSARIIKAKCEGEMFRGFEVILKGRDPLDAQQITQRICGVCPISHGIASIRAQEMAYGISPTHNGRLLQNLIFASNYLQSHILHFYHLCAVDFVDVTAILNYTGNDRTLRTLQGWVKEQIESNDIFPAAPFLPRYDADYLKDTDANCMLLAHYVQALKIRQLAHEAAAVWSGKIPHATALVPGGCTQNVTIERILSYKSRLKEIKAFVDDIYFYDVIAVAKVFPQFWDVGKGYGNLLCYGVFELDDAGKNKLFEPGVFINGKWEKLNVEHITEEVAYSRFSSATSLHPSKGESDPAPNKSSAYSWLKAPRYKGEPMEVGPAARIVTNYYAPNSNLKPEIEGILKVLAIEPEKLVSVLGRHLCRALEAKILAEKCLEWVEELKPDAPTATDFEIPKSASGYGLTEAPRGALGHWITISNYLIERYQCVVPTTWNCSPRDDAGKPGPVEKALEGVVLDNAEQPMNAARVVRSFDPCIACAVH